MAVCDALEKLMVARSQPPAPPVQDPPRASDPPSVPDGDISLVAQAKFDKRAYQRELMRNRRAAEKEKKALSK